jgi:hypothetical protein
VLLKDYENEINSNVFPFHVTQIYSGIYVPLKRSLHNSSFNIYNFSNFLRANKKNINNCYTLSYIKWLSPHSIVYLPFSKGVNKKTLYLSAFSKQGITLTCRLTFLDVTTILCLQSPNMHRCNTPSAKGVKSVNLKYIGINKEKR